MKTRRFAVMVTALILAVGLLFLYLAMIRSSASAFVPSLAATAPADIPTVTAVNPDFAPNDLDTPIVITGTGFAVNATVQFNADSATANGSIHVADVAGDSAKERVAVYGHFLTVCGPKFRDGKQFFFRDLGGDVLQVQGQVWRDGRF